MKNHGVMLAAFWLALGASAVLLALLCAFCLFGAILVVRPTPSVSLRAVVIGLGCAVMGLLLAWAANHLAWYFAALVLGSTGFATAYLFSLLASLPEFERKDVSPVATSALIWCVWVTLIAFLWSSHLPGITETKQIWDKVVESFRP